MGADVHDVALIVAASIPAIGAFVLGVMVLARQRVHGVAINQINTAVNHQPVEGPTLVERVTAIESNMETHVEWEREHYTWILDSMNVIAHHVGATLPPHPERENK